MVRNSVLNDCTAAWTGQTGAISFTQSHNDFFNCGTSPGGTGAQTVDPLFVGPESVPQPTIGSGYFVNGKRLWDWAGVYQPIIDRFRTQQASLVNAGTGTAAPCTGTCDIGANEFFSFQGVPPAFWQSCASIGNGVTPPAGAGPPWRNSPSGLVIDVDCAAKRFVIGRCSDPLDGATCDTDIYIRKAGYVRKKRVNEPVTLSSGASGSPTDTSGNCWRTRATLDFTESLEELNGIWIDWHIDPDGGSFTCPSTLSNGLWAFQGHQ